MIKIYHAPHTRSLRVIWLCEELGVPYTVVPVSFDAEYRFSAEWLAKNPVGKVPVMEDGNLMIFESGAMVQTIVDRYGDGRLQPPPGTDEHALYLQWCWFAEATFSRPLGEIVNHRRNFSPDITAVVDEMKGRAHQCLSAVNDAVQGRPFILDKFSAADIMMGYCLMLIDMLAPTDEYVEARRYWDALKARPAAAKTFT